MTDAPKQYRYRETIEAIQWDGTEQSAETIFDYGYEIAVDTEGDTYLYGSVTKGEIELNDWIVFSGGSFPDIISNKQFHRDYEPVPDAWEVSSGSKWTTRTGDVIDNCFMPPPLPVDDEPVPVEQAASLDDVIKAKDQAYYERNQLVALLSKIYPSWLERHPDSDELWEDDWRNIVFVDTPQGQASWHIHDSEFLFFSHLVMRAGNSWDGHTVDEKYARLKKVEQAEGGWRLIESAPIGEEVLLGRIDSDIQRVGYFSHTSDCWISSEKESSIFPTHWRFLPKPPAREGDGA